LGVSSEEALASLESVSEALLLLEKGLVIAATVLESEEVCRNGAVEASAWGVAVLLAEERENLVTVIIDAGGSATSAFDPVLASPVVVVG